MGKKSEKIAPPPEPKKGPGRPLKDINWTTFETLCGIDCTQPEIAAALGIDEDTLRSRVEGQYGKKYSVVYKEFRDKGNASVRRALYDEAVNRRNSKVLIHVANNRLGHSNKVTVDGSVGTGGPTMDDVKKVITDPVASKLARELAERMLEIEEKTQNEQTPEESAKG